MSDFELICVDLQNDFVDEKGINFNKGKSVSFIKNILLPYLIKNRIKVSEIISDYRLPRGKSKNESCVPGSFGYESILPQEIRKSNPWIKCMHNPLWTRENIGIPDSKLGEPYQDPGRFNQWVENNIKNNKVVLFGETADCCLLQVASELYFRGYEVYYIYEATDPMNERLENKDNILFNSTVAIYTKVIRYNEFLDLLGGHNNG